MWTTIEDHTCFTCRNFRSCHYYNMGIEQTCLAEKAEALGEKVEYTYEPIEY